MRTLVDEALAVGAIGFATSDYPHHYGFGGRPVPSRLAEYQETRTLTDALAKAPGSIFQSTLGPHLGFEQFGEIATRTNATVMWGGLLATQILVDVDHRAQLRAIEDMQARGIRFFPQVTPRPILFEFKFSDPFPLSMLLPFKGIDQQPRERQIAAYRDPAFRRAAAEAIAARDDIYRMAFVEAVISEDADASLDGRPAAEIARERGVPQLDLMLDLAVAGGLETRFRMPVANHDEAEAIRIVTSPSTLIALSDAGAHADQLCDACIPTYLLGRWVRDLGVMSLENAIWKLAGQPAAIYGIAARGVLREGAFADVVVLDPSTIAAGPLRRVRDLPAAGTRLVSDAVGIDAVIVNGTVIRRDGRDAIAPDDQMPGRLLRRGTSISA
jgi:N-acyl-D-aspartate/D-glutamate deacylase